MIFFTSVGGARVKCVGGLRRTCTAIVPSSPVLLVAFTHAVYTEGLLLIENLVTWIATGHESNFNINFYGVSDDLVNLNTHTKLLKLD